MTDEERDTAVDELIAERDAMRPYDRPPMADYLGLTRDQFDLFLVSGELPPGYVPPNRDGHKSPAERTRNAITWVLFALLAAGVLAWLAILLESPK